eukprot:g342.t1
MLGLFAAMLAQHQQQKYHLEELKKMTKRGRQETEPVELLTELALGAAKLQVLRSVIDLNIVDRLLLKHRNEESSDVRGIEVNELIGFVYRNTRQDSANSVKNSAPSDDFVDITKRLLRTASSMGLLDYPAPCAVDGSSSSRRRLVCVFANTVTAHLRRGGARGSAGQRNGGETAPADTLVSSAVLEKNQAVLGAFITTRSGPLAGGWLHLTDAIRSIGRVGTPTTTAFEIYHGTSAGAYFSVPGPNRADLARDALYERQTLCGKSTRRLFAAVLSSSRDDGTPLYSIATLASKSFVIVDVGSGADASDLTALTEVARERVVELSVVKTFEGIAFDVPQVASKGTENTIEGRSDGGLLSVRFVGGNFFKDVPFGDLFLLKNVLHAAGSDRIALRILDRLHEASMTQLAPSYVLVIDPVLDDQKENDDGSEASYSNLHDLNLFVTGGGRDRTMSQWYTLFGLSGFEVVRVTPASHLEGRPAPVLCRSSAFLLRPRSK